MPITRLPHRCPNPCSGIPLDMRCRKISESTWKPTMRARWTTRSWGSISMPAAPRCGSTRHSAIGPRGTRRRTTGKSSARYMRFLPRKTPGRPEGPTMTRARQSMGAMATGTTTGCTIMRIIIISVPIQRKSWGQWQATWPESGAQVPSTRKKSKEIPT